MFHILFRGENKFFYSIIVSFCEFNADVRMINVDFFQISDFPYYVIKTKQNFYS